jgi:hypothetical protein
MRSACGSNLHPHTVSYRRCTFGVSFQAATAISQGAVQNVAVRPVALRGGIATFVERLHSAMFSSGAVGVISFSSITAEVRFRVGSRPRWRAGPPRPARSRQLPQRLALRSLIAHRRIVLNKGGLTLCLSRAWRCRLKAMFGSAKWATQHISPAVTRRASLSNRSGQIRTCAGNERSHPKRRSCRRRSCRRSRFPG